jgi:hypothetical protein
MRVNVSLFRASARVVGPDGRVWEIYQYRLTLANRGMADGGPFADGTDGYSASAIGADAELAIGVIDAVVWLLGTVVRAIFMLVWDLPRSALAAHRSDEWTVELVTWFPREERRKWITHGDQRAFVVAELKDQLLRGELPRPMRATPVD